MAVQWEQRAFLHPDYIGYHLKEDFEAWYTQQEQQISATDISDISLSTDGIFTFSKFDQGHFPEKETVDLIHDLLIDRADISNERMLLKKLDHIEKYFGLRPTDDLGIVRLVL